MAPQRRKHNDIPEYDGMAQKDEFLFYTNTSYYVREGLPFPLKLLKIQHYKQLWLEGKPSINHSCFFHAAESEEPMELRYFRNGDYLYPNMELEESEKIPIGKYGLMRQQYLQEHRPVLCMQLLLSGKLMRHLHEVDKACHDRLEQMIREMSLTEGVSEQLKATDQLEWIQRMNSIHNRAEEIILKELVFD